MATKAFVLIETTVGKTGEVVAKVRQLEGVKSVDTVTGPYDAIAIMELESDGIGDLVKGRMRPIAGISRTVVCQAIGTSMNGNSEHKKEVKNVLEKETSRGATQTKGYVSATAKLPND